MINGFRKEMMFFTRGGRMAVVLTAIFALALMSPLMFGAMQSMIGALEQMYDEETYTSMFTMFSNMSAAEITAYTVDSVAEFGAIIILFVFKGAAGGEQQKRSVIIPQCSGLSAVSYALPKFLIYPAFICAVSVIAVYAGAGASLAVFGGALDWGMVTVAAVCTGIFLAFSTVVQFCIGICTGRSGLAIVICILMQMFLPSMLALFRVDRFNPFALRSIAMSAAIGAGDSTDSLLAVLDSASASNDVTPLNITVSIGTAVVISILLYFITIFALHTKEVHNEGDEPVL